MMERHLEKGRPRKAAKDATFRKGKSFIAFPLRPFAIFAPSRETLNVFKGGSA